MTVDATEAVTDHGREAPSAARMESVASQTELAEHLARLSLDLQSQKNEPLTLQRIVELAVETVVGCEWAGISLRTAHSPAEAAAATGPLVREADKLQEQLQEGPCYDTAQTAESHISPDLSVDTRWPHWGPRVVEFGIRSVLSVQLRGSDGELFGALNLYAPARDAFTRADLDEALIFAAHAGGALGQSRELTGLREALRSRHLIGVAQGMLIQRYDLTLDQAFNVLARRSQESNTKLRDVAARIVEGGTLLAQRDDVTVATRS